MAIFILVTIYAFSEEFKCHALILGSFQNLANLRAISTISNASI
jgi:hypothetical protein